MLHRFLSKLSIKALVHNLSWMMVSELLSRSSRFVTLFVLAASFTSAEYGTVMLALLCHELLRVFTRLGAGAMIIQCKDSELDDVSRNAATLQWSISIVVALVQIAIAPLLARFYSNPDLNTLLSIMAVAHVIYPLVSIKVFQLQRNNRLRYFGIASGLCVGFENILVAFLVYINIDIVMVAFSKIAAAAFWVILFYPAYRTHIRPSINLKTIVSLLRFSSKVFGSDLVRALRGQTDSLFAARLLSPELFGVYSFAKSASIGISQSFTSAYLSAAYPYLAQQQRQDNWSQGVRNILITTVLIALIYLIQSGLANWYINWLFNDRWSSATDIASILCLIAIPMLCMDIQSITWRIRNRVNHELYYNIACALLIPMALFFIQPTSPIGFAWVMLGLGTIWLFLGLALGLLSCRLFKPAPAASIRLGYNASV